MVCLKGFVVELWNQWQAQKDIHRKIARDCKQWFLYWILVYVDSLGELFREEEGPPLTQIFFNMDFSGHRQDNSLRLG